MDIINIEELKAKGYYLGVIDGEKCQDVDSFLSEIGKAFRFPGYYGQNFPAFDECINDLDWLEGYENYVLIIKNSNKFLALVDEDKRKNVYRLLIDPIQEWANVPNFKGEEEFRKKADFKIVFE